MLRMISVSITLLFSALASNAQGVGFSPELLFGHRSLTYQHFVAHRFDDKWSINNVSYFDTEYTNETNDIYFIRNMVSFHFNKHIQVNAAIGAKNPGSFATLTTQYKFSVSSFKFSYAIGSTYQNGFTLEQNLILNYTPVLSKDIKAYLNLFVIVNTDFEILNRGIQQFRIGIQKENLITGIAVNLDQFTGGVKTLQNYGLFIKCNF
jgi:hypothetical protein